MCSPLVTLDHKWSPERKELVKRTVAKDCTDDELALFEYVCHRTGLDPFIRQIYAIKRKQKDKYVMTLQTGIDGYRLIAERTGKYSPGKETSFTYDENKRLISATAYVKKMTLDGTWHEVSTTAHYSEYVGVIRDYQSGITKPNDFWATKPHIMLAKCAEALALRKAFPAELSGVYTKEEMDQADNDPSIEITPEIQVTPVTLVTPEVPKIGCSDEEINKFYLEFGENEGPSIAQWIHEVAAWHKMSESEVIAQVQADRVEKLKSYDTWKQKSRQMLK